MIAQRSAIHLGWKHPQFFRREIYVIIWSQFSFLLFMMKARFFSKTNFYQIQIKCPLNGIRAKKVEKKLRICFLFFSECPQTPTLLRSVNRRHSSRKPNAARLKPYTFKTMCAIVCLCRHFGWSILCWASFLSLLHLRLGKFTNETEKNGSLKISLSSFCTGTVKQA